MLHIKFQASEQCGSKEEVFEYFSMYICGSNLGLGAILGPSFEKKNLDKDNKAMLHTKFQTAEPSGSEEKKDF